MLSCETYWARIFLGLPEPYGAAVEEKIRQCAAGANLMVSAVPCEFIASDHKEHGCIVGLINLPYAAKDRSPADRKRLIRGRGFRLAGLLRRTFGQHKVTVSFPDETFLLEENYADHSQ